MSQSAHLETLHAQDVAAPPCPHFGPCGGCQLQDLTYSAQLTHKATQLRALLEATGLPLPELQLHASPPLAYRNRIRLTLAEGPGQLRAGYLTSPANNQQPTFLPITQCPIAAPILWRATEALLAELNLRSTVWRERAPFTLDQVELFATPEDAPAEARLQISLVVRTSAKSLPARFDAELASLCESLRASIPVLTGAGLYLIPPRSVRSRRVEQPRLGPSWGSPGLNYTVSPVEPRTPSPEPGPTYWVPRGAFFQVNRYLLPQLLALVTANRRGGLAWDLYAGVGLFTNALAPHFNRITAVEIAEPAFTALNSGKLPHRHAVKATTLDFLRSAVLQRERPDFIVLDPPRTGAGPEVCELLGRVAAPTLLYVSCSPETLPADLTTLAASGYRVAELHLLDLFPQTTHIETIVTLCK
jgi:23S rRNA (uracil1939-C5)-methyltransferase